MHAHGPAPVQHPRHGIVPPYLLQRLAGSDDTTTAERARRALALDGLHRGRRMGLPTPGTPAPGPAPAPAEPPDDGTGPRRTVSDAHGTEDLPGDTVRAEGAPATGDAAADEAYDGLGATWALYREVYGRDSLDDAGLALGATVHYGQDYDNAFWDGSRMVFGDGDGTVFTRFTVAVDVIGHELTHGVTEKTAHLTYQGQSGALNESISDVFGSMVKQRGLGQDAAAADWLIGAGLFVPGIKGVALRSMKAPGTAYDDPALGKDPQPATMDGYVETTNDNGGVHLNSGIPNHAFYLAATAIGADAWEGAGQVWYDVLTGGDLAADADFAAFAGLTVAAATARFGAGSTQAQAVSDAWARVKVAVGSGGPTPTPKPTPPPAPKPAPPPAPPPAPAPAPAPEPSPAPGGGSPQTVLVRRSGGLAGRTLEREVPLADLPAEQADAWRSLLGSGRLHALPAAEPAPDRYVYRVLCRDAGLDVSTGERQLPVEVRSLLDSTLRGD